MGIFSHPALPAAAKEFLPSYAFNQSVIKAFSRQGLPASFSPAGIMQWYQSNGDPLLSAIAFANVLSVVIWLLGEVTGNISQVDRLWAILPVLYSAHFTFWPSWTGRGDVDQRMLLVFGLQCLWSLRLSINTYRRGFFNPKTEDYRWEVVRARIPTWQYKLMNFFFVAFIQNWLLLSVELPQYLLLTLTSAYSRTLTRVPTLGEVDYLLAGLFVLILCIEMLADQQQQIYQNFKQNAKSLKKKEDGGKLLTEHDQGRLNRGFVTDGLWSWSRHPNFACEQSTWYVMYLYTVLPFLPKQFKWSTVSYHIRNTSSISDAVTLFKRMQGVLWNYSIWGPICMTLLFYASTQLTEEISAGKYPLYKEYQKRVGEFWPPVTTLKTIWLLVTGQLGNVNQIVFGNGKPRKA